MDHRLGDPLCREDMRDFVVSIPSSIPNENISRMSSSCVGFEFVYPSQWSKIYNGLLPWDRYQGGCLMFWLYVWGCGWGFNRGVGRHFWRDTGYF